ncbi:3-hydroxyacyl-ACP dehydratase FabZ family protein [Maridesulfovibrio hydrothermalis]|uniref:Beta-hydroxyacyl-(Acyl-carrier-protein) dehydratase FabA/FabZ n=1 Tax=Maridesulfovibrio hydrothermalis AM13 = DSM 14728 TaxID=1121451 RepID=L0RB82_9BACT|nr:beta-hydroxyacyl-ACP dehydratase [Maridesulfovibrio hydrothermalis]CCO23425.1 Beta-hydroxyacyl-(Acyl-carrier-protein) dehydratase FabA/FabZ [Maridesulfovibrio hydrothermalis AM13 = DSM 14728]
MDLRNHIENSATTLESRDGAYTRSFCFKPDFPGFDGHFPDNPILPGVVQVLLGELSSLIGLSAEYPNKKFTLESVTRCKFLRPVKPDETLCLKFTIKAKELKYITICSLTVNGETAASYQLIFSPKADL